MKRQSRLVAMGLAIAPAILAACSGSEQSGPHAAGPGVSRYARIPADLGGAAPADSSGPAGSAAPRPAANPAGSPKLRKADILGSIDRVAGLTAVHVGDRTLLAWTTYAEPSRTEGAQPAPGSRRAAAGKAAPRAKAPPRAKVMVRLFDRSMAPQGAPITMSTSAESVGGIAATAGRADREDACIAWIEADAASKQIALALVGKDGKTLSRRVQTGGKLTPSDVALAATTDGWVVGWVDQRDGAPQVYAAHVTPELKILAPERRLSRGSGEPSEVQLLVRGETTLVAWNTVDHDRADVFLAALHGADLRGGDDVRIASLAGTAHGVRLGALEDRAVLGWMETPAKPAAAASPRTTPAAAASPRTTPAAAASPRTTPAAASSSAAAPASRQDPTDSRGGGARPRRLERLGHRRRSEGSGQPGGPVDGPWLQRRKMPHRLGASCRGERHARGGRTRLERAGRPCCRGATHGHSGRRARRREPGLDRRLPRVRGGHPARTGQTT